MVVTLTCKYCDNKWDRNIYSKEAVASLECPKCKDDNIKVTEIIKIDTYKGAPPFPEDTDESFPEYYRYLNEGGQ